MSKKEKAELRYHATELADYLRSIACDNKFIVTHVNNLLCYSLEDTDWYWVMWSYYYSLVTDPEINDPTGEKFKLFKLSAGKE